MGVKDVKQTKKQRQIFATENKRFVQLLDKTNENTMKVSDAILELGITNIKWYSLKKEWYRLNGKNYGK